MPLKSPVRKVIRNLNIKKIFPKYKPENTLIKTEIGRLEKVWLYRNVFREIGERTNIIMLRMILFLEIRKLEKGWLYRNVFYIEMYFGRLIAFQEIRKLEKVWLHQKVFYIEMYFGRLIAFQEIRKLEKGWLYRNVLRWIRSLEIGRLWIKEGVTGDYLSQFRNDNIGIVRHGEPSGNDTHQVRHV